MKREKSNLQYMAYNYRPVHPASRPAGQAGLQLPPKKHRRWPKFILTLVILAVGLGVYALFVRNDNPPDVIKKITQTVSEPQPKTVKGRYLISGTIVLDRVVASEAGDDYTQPFSYMDTLGEFDEGIADLECPVTDSSYVSVKGQENPRFNCQPHWLPELKKYFGIIKLAGNHTYDMGAAGFTETVDRLQKAGIQAVGHHNPHVEKDNCKVVAFPVRLQISDGKEEKGTLPIAVCAFNYKIIFAPEAGEIEAIQRYAKIMPVFGLLQAGAEYITTASAQQRSYAHKIIDNGAAFVIANGTHYVQDSEVYKNKLIVYSLGNFIFDQTDYETMRAVSIAVDIVANYDQNVSKWLALSSKCNATAREDNCLEEAEKQGLSKINLAIKFEPIGTSGGVRQITKRAGATLQKAIEQRLNWTQTVKELGQ
ncbi:MAG: CapA family protein [Candidatus Saccharimonadales bacterium]